MVRMRRRAHRMAMGLIGAIVVLIAVATVSHSAQMTELKGLVKQIQYLRAKCIREETFRADLVFVKKWFLMQVSMYNAW